MAGPAAVIVAGAFTMTLAFTHQDPLVATDYYKRGVEINKELAAEKARHAEEQP